MKKATEENNRAVDNMEKTISRMMKLKTVTRIFEVALDHFTHHFLTDHIPYYAMVLLISNFTLTIA